MCDRGQIFLLPLLALLAFNVPGSIWATALDANRNITLINTIYFYRNQKSHASIATAQCLVDAIADHQVTIGQFAIFFLPKAKALRYRSISLAIF